MLVLGVQLLLLLDLVRILSNDFLAAPGAAAAQDAPAEEAKEEAKEESDDDMGFGLFD